MDKLSKIQDILDKAVNESWYKYSFKVKLIQSRWPDIVGDKLSEFTLPYRIYNQTLYVRCSHQGWIQTLHYHKKSILEKIQKYSEDNKIIICDVRFTFGQIIRSSRHVSKSKDNQRKEVPKDNISFKILKNLLNQFFDS